MNRIELAQLRDIAIEYLPAAQQARDNFKQWCRVQKLSPKNYAGNLVETAIKIRCDVTLPAVERAAANLLEAVSMWQFYDPNDPELEGIDPTEHQAYSMRKIAEAADTLAKITGRDMAHLMPADAPGAKSKAVRGITKQRVIAAFKGLHFDSDTRWSKALADKSIEWLKPCKVVPGSKSASALWNPVLIGCALLDKKITLKRLDAVFNLTMKDWADEWLEATARERD